MSKGYTTVSNIASFMGLTLTTAQQTWATALMDPAEALVDLYTRQSWSPSNVVITNEQYALLRDWIILRTVPVQSIQSILVRTRQVGDSGQTLTAGTDYELQNAATGLVVLAKGYGDRETLLTEELAAGYPQDTDLSVIGSPEGLDRAYALVSYTASVPVPADVTQATTMLVAHWMATNVDPLRFETSQLKVSTRMAKFQAAGIPAEVREILDYRKRSGIFA